MEGLKASEVDLVVYLHPSKTKRVSESINRELNSLLFTFNETFDGVVLAYEIVEILDKRAKILSGLDPYIGARMKANFLLFSPKPDMFLEGKVKLIARDSLKIVVLGFSPCVIAGEDIRAELKYKIKQGQQVFKSRYHRRHVIGVDTVVRFQVKSFDEDTLHIAGSLVPACTGNVQWLATNMKDEHSANRTVEKRKANERKSFTEGNVGGPYGEGALASQSDYIFKTPKRQRVEGVS